MRHIKAVSLAVLLLAVSWAGTIDKEKKQEKRQLVQLETVYGTMKIELYNETPLHRDNFLKLVNEKYFDSILFHRVIKDFMIQGGDPDSKNAPAGKMLGEGGPGYDIPAEFVPGIFHKKGALAAAREGDQVNPEKKSSGSQFYIVQGNVFTADQLKQMEEGKNGPQKQKCFSDFIMDPANAQLKTKLDSLNQVQDMQALEAEIQGIVTQLEPEFDKLDLYKLTDEQIQAYTTIGGTPHLDGNYTVFGQVIEGLNVIDSIANVPTDANNRPVTNIIMKIKVVKK